MDFKKIRIVLLLIFLGLTNSIFSQTIKDATTLMEKYEYKKSIAVLDQLIKKNPDDAIAYSYRGYAYMMTYQYDKALADYRKANGISSTIETLSGMQWALLAMGKSDESISTGNNVLAIDPNNYFAKSRIADALTQKLEYDDSIEVLDQLIDKYPEDSISYSKRGYAFMMKGEYKKALADYKKANGIYSTLDTQSGIQWALLASGKYDESIAEGNKILVIDPNNYFAKQRIADAYLEKKDYIKASEAYNQMQTQFGKNADLLWKIGLCEHYTGNKEKATQLFKEGNKLYPEHKGIQYSLGIGHTGYPYLAVIPEYNSFNFRGSDFVGGGHKAGLGVSYSHDADLNIRASVVNDVTQNLNSSKGVENYITNPYNVMYYSTYSIGTYLALPINLYYLNNLLGSQAYSTNKYHLGVTYKLSDKFSVNFSPQMIQSNTPWLNGGSTGQIGISYTNKFVLSASTAVISNPYNKGGQGSVSFYYPFLEKFYSTSTITGQHMTITSSETSLISISPLYCITKNVNHEKGYGFFQQELGYTGSLFFASAGGRYGTARTPLMGENWIYTGFDLLYGAYGQIGVKSDNLTFQIQYSQDRWLDSRNEKPTSDSIKFTLVWRAL